MVEGKSSNKNKNSLAYITHNEIKKETRTNSKIRIADKLHETMRNSHFFVFFLLLLMKICGEGEETFLYRAAIINDIK